MAQVDNRDNAIERHFFNRISDHSPAFINEYVPRIYKSGQCAILISTMKLIKESHFGFIVGDIPVTTTDTASFDQVRAVVEQVDNYCVKDPPQGKKQGGIQRAGRNLNLAVVVFGEGMFAQYLSMVYHFNWQDRTPGPWLGAGPGATA